jgi:FtsP/CotA-like multicopper oxidase with cupredoxin domain
MAAALACVPQLSSADDIVEPHVFSSANSGGVLDLLMVAKAKPVPTISFLPPNGGAPINPIGWVYEICPRPASGNQCPADATTFSDYGGVRLALRPGDVLKIRLVNQLPVLNPAKVKHAGEPGQADLFRNPTNLHTHGLIVPARPSMPNDPAFGDYVFMQIYNSANGMPATQGSHQHGPNKIDFADYRIDIPADHPSGLFWFHPMFMGSRSIKYLRAWRASYRSAKWRTMSNPVRPSFATSFSRTCRFSRPGLWTIAGAQST